MNKNEDGGRRSYHHGNLREALIFAAISLIADRGLQGFTLVEAARAAGVSPSAPYRHFRDREALLCEVAHYGFERFADRLENAWNKGQPTAISAFEAVGRAYLDFAREERPLFVAMFQPELPNEPALVAAMDRAFGVLLTASREIVSRLPANDRPPAHMVSYHIWALSHGVAELFAQDRKRRAPISPEDMLESAIMIYLRGLGLLPEKI